MCWGLLWTYVEITNYLQVIKKDVFLTIIFKIGLLPCFKLITIGMKQDTLIEHKETVVICD
jgi:hypothetical protein